jgi:multicomponent Na+:H+ antiporter subunit D
MDITPLPVVVPMLAAAGLVAVRHWISRTVADVTAVGVSVAVVAMCTLILSRALGHPFTYWMAGWRPAHLVSIGISFSIDPVGAGAATLAALLVTAALVYSWRYFEAADGLFHALMMLFLAALVGFSLTGDLFNLIVFFELMGAVAYALTAYRIEERAPIQGAVNFAISNSVAAYAMFVGLGLLYARTGALNMTQIGAGLDGHRADALVVVAMALLLAGFLTKAAAIPLHFWLGDAHSVAPTPVCVLFSGVMVELGLYAVARLYWTIFAGPVGAHAAQMRGILIAFGTATAVWGAVMCFVQRHIKRLLAFSTISHVGVFLCGIGLLSASGLSGAAIYVVGHGLTKAALFMLAGVLLHRWGTVDEFDLHGRGQNMRFVGGLFALGGLLLAALPGVTTFFDKSMIESAAIDGHYRWLPAVLLFSSLATGGAVLRVSGRVFMGWGAAERHDDVQLRQAGEEGDEEAVSRQTTPALMIATPAVLLAAAMVIGLIPGVVPAFETAAAHFVDHGAYVDWVLRGALAHFAPVEHGHIAGYDYLYAAGGAIGAAALGALALFGDPIIPRLPRPLARGTLAAVNRLRRLHSGHIGDYIAWWTTGTALLGSLSLLLLR